MGGDPFQDPVVAWGSTKFAGGLMAILLAHEMAHFVVARAHGFRLSLPYFIPFPAAFGTFGAIIRLKSLPRSRNALLEMGAAGPLAGFLLAVLAIGFGLPGTVELAAPEVVMSWPPQLPDPTEPGRLARVLAAVLPVADPGTVPLMILANPPIMDWMGTWILGAPPGRYASLDPLAMAGWVGCLLTAINLVPIGQLDGGHVTGALWPAWALRLSRGFLLLALLGGILWTGWAFWAVLLVLMGAHQSLPVPAHPPLSRRARWVAVATALSFLCCFMPTPIEVEEFPVQALHIVTPEGKPVPAAEVEAWVQEQLADRGL
jgi:membrane-associated protease RseP (regulator of RpoE activity)